MLNIGSTGGDFGPYVKYNAKAGRWYMKGTDGEIEVQNPVFVADFDNIKTGWLLFLEGQAPSKVWDESLQTPAASPSEKHKRGFQLRLFSNDNFGGVVELASSSMHLCASINEMYSKYDSEKNSNQGKLPVFKYTGSTPMKDKMGTNYKPNFEFVKWVDRPAELDTTSQEPAASQNNAPATAQVASGGSEF